MNSAHLPNCRRQMEDIMPNYGSDCTCGHQYLTDLLYEHKHLNPSELATVLNEKLQWIEKHSDEDFFAATNAMKNLQTYINDCKDYGDEPEINELEGIVAIWKPRHV